MNSSLSVSAKIHVYLVSDQATPNILPAYDKRIKPDIVYLLHGEDDVAFAQGLKEVLVQLGVKVYFWPIDNVWHKDHIQLRLLELFELLNITDNNCQVALNLSGGNQLSCVAAFETFLAYQQAVFHIQPHSDQLTWLHPNDLASFNLQDSIRLEPFLLAYGVKLKSKPIRHVANAKQLTLATDILTNIEQYASVLPTLNYLANTAQGSLVSSPLQNTHKDLLALIDAFEQAGQLSLKNNCLHFNDEATRFFVNGGWIELYVFDVIRQCRKQFAQIQDVAYSVNVYRDANGHEIPNEIDVAFLYNNRLHIVECKTMVFKSSKRRVSGANTLYKLDSLSDVLGGLHAKAMLVSFMKLPKHDWQRAKDLNIDVCAAEQLLHLKDYILDFINS